MSTTVEWLEPGGVWAPPASKPLNEAVWQAWLAKGRAQDRRSSAMRMKVVTWASILGLVAAAGLWSHAAPFETVTRFLVTAGAMTAMFEAVQARNYVVAAVFGALALLYNPVAAAFTFSGDWQRAVVLASAGPFIASLVWPKGKNARRKSND